MSKSTKSLKIPNSISGTPLLVLFDLLGKRWTMRILWEMRFGAIHFRALQDKGGGISPTMLNRRLKELQEHKLVALSEDGYYFTELGQSLFEVMLPLADWAQHWADGLESAEETIQKFENKK